MGRPPSRALTMRNECMFQQYEEGAEPFAHALLKASLVFLFDNGRVALIKQKGRELGYVDGPVLVGVVLVRVAQNQPIKTLGSHESKKITISGIKSRFCRDDE